MSLSQISNLLNNDELMLFSVSMSVCCVMIELSSSRALQYEQLRAALDRSILLGEKLPGKENRDHATTRVRKLFLWGLVFHLLYTYPASITSFYLILHRRVSKLLKRKLLRFRNWLLLLKLREGFSSQFLASDGGHIEFRQPGSNNWCPFLMLYDQVNCKSWVCEILLTF